ncbi:Cyclin-dependent kinase 12 [Aphelenchoides bicaudatus]|nr:Cyclin-dependent kinase 12 [Aphelenchoides bicaudatus]
MGPHKSRNRSPRRRSSPQNSSSSRRHSRERRNRTRSRSRSRSKERRSHKRSRKSKFDRRRSTSSSDSSSPLPRKSTSTNNSNHIKAVPPPTPVVPKLPFPGFHHNLMFAGQYPFMQPHFGMPPPAFNNLYQNPLTPQSSNWPMGPNQAFFKGNMMQDFGFLCPPPPPPEEIFVEPPPPPLLPAPKSPTNANGSAEESTSKIDNDAISAAMRNRPRILQKRKVPCLPSNWGKVTTDSYSIIVQVGEGTLSNTLFDFILIALGTYGHVYKAKRKDSPAELVALKKVRLENEREGFPITAVREIKLLRRLDHPNIVKLLDVVTETNTQGNKREFNAFFLVFEYVDHDLNGLLESGMVEFTQDQIASLFKQLLLALQHCHSKDLLHRDLKCANILINNRGELKLGDFGLARIYLKNNDRLYTNRVITLWYRPPELLLGEEKYGPSVDIWSAGCILGELFTKKPIFQGHNEQQQLEQITQCCGVPTAEVWPDVINLPIFSQIHFRSNNYQRLLRTKFSFFPPPALDLFDQLLALDPKKRPSAKKALDHEWIRNINPSKVPPPDLPKHQDCHERWAKVRKTEQQRSKRSSSLNVNNSQNHDSAVAI